MTHRSRRRQIHLENVSVSLSGIDPSTARAVAALLPATVAAQVSAGGAVPPPASDTSAAGIAARLGHEIASRIQPQIQAKTKET